MNALQRKTGEVGCRRLRHGLAALALVWGGGALAQDVVSVPAAHLHHAEGSVAYAPQGDKEWHDVQPRRILKRGDRLWTDRGSRAEVQAGGQALRLNGETQIVLENVGDTATQLSLTQGTIAATVTHLNPGDSFEIGTPNLAFRARQPGEYRIDVDTKTGMTRIFVHSGSAVVYGEKGEALEVKNGQRVSFKDRNLSRVLQPAFAVTDEFDKWVGARSRGEPTVSMPAVAQAPAAGPSAPASPFVNKGRDIVISGPPSSLPGARSTAAVQAAAPIPAATPATPVAKAQALPNVVTSTPSAAPLRVTAPGSSAVASASPNAAAKAEAEARARAQVEAAAQAAREQAERDRVAQQREEDRRAAAARAEVEKRAAALAEARRADMERRAAAAAETKRAESERRAADAKRAESERRAEAKREDKRRAVAAARRAEEEKRAAHAKRDQESRRLAAAKKAEEERRVAQARHAAEERKLAARKAAEDRKIAEARKLQLARLQEQARRDEQSAQARREQARKADEGRREEQAWREEQAKREELARREEDLRRQRAAAEQARRDQERQDREVWLRQQQVPMQPVRPAPMGVPIRRVS